MTSARLRELVPGVMLSSRGFSYDSHFPTGSPACPFAGFMVPTASPLRSSRCALVQDHHALLAIAYDSNVLGLGPDSPWVDQRCPGTLRLTVCLIPTDMTLLIPAFALLCAPPVLTVELLCPENAPLPSPLALVHARPCGRTYRRGKTRSTASV